MLPCTNRNRCIAPGELYASYRPQSILKPPSSGSPHRSSRLGVVGLRASKVEQRRPGGARGVRVVAIARGILTVS